MVIKEDSLPDFKNLDKEYGLKLVMGIQSAYIQILKGLIKYKELNYEQMNKEELQRTAHTIKGLSASAGALNLSNLALELEESASKQNLSSFKEELLKVVDEIEEKLFIKKENKKQLEESKKQELFESLKEAVKTKRAKNTKPILKEIKQYELENKDKQKFNEIEELINKFKFKQALELF